MDNALAWQGAGITITQAIIGLEVSLYNYIIP
jgi:hypothetical protein